MTISRDTKTKGHIIECDRCGDTDYSDEREFNDAWQDMKDNGWRFVNGSHICEDCFGDMP